MVFAAAAAAAGEEQLHVPVRGVGRRGALEQRNSLTATDASDATAAAAADEDAS